MRERVINKGELTMTVELIDRETKLTDAEFKALERNSEGRIIDDFDMAWVWMTDAQKERLHGDDQSRGFDVDEEIGYMMADLY
jgi:hypothetical protein